MEAKGLLTEAEAAELVERAERCDYQPPGAAAIKHGGAARPCPLSLPPLSLHPKKELPNPICPLCVQRLASRSS